MTDGGCAASALPDLQGEWSAQEAFVAGSASQRTKDADYLDAFAARLIAGPRKRAAWEAPISAHQHDPEFARNAGQLIQGLAQSIRAGLADKASR